MPNRITHVTRHVGDPEEALAFYRDVLGFRIASDIENPPGRRWLTLTAPGQSELELILLSVDSWFTGDERQGARASLGHQPQLVLATDDIDGLYARLKAAGARLDMPEVGQQPWGRDLAFRDPTGSSVYAVQS